jgi:flagellar motor switch protein FliM
VSDAPNQIDGPLQDSGDDRDHLPGASSERILNQDEIDSLLGFNLDEGEDDENSGVRAIINSALVSYERLPMLEIVFDRLVRLMTTSLRNFTSDNVEVSLDNISSIRFGDYLKSIPLPAILAVFRAQELDNYGLLTVDSNLIYSIVDVLLGGRRGTAAMRIEGRPYTTIERVLVQRMVEVVLADAKAAFEPLTPLNFVLDRLETNPRFAAIARPANAAILVKLRIDMEDRGGRIELLLPYGTLEPIRKMLLQQFMGEKFGRDNIWESHLATELWSTQTEVRAVLDEQKISLKRVLNLKVGQTIMLNATPDSPVEIRAGTIPLTKGRMGRRNHMMAVRVDAPLTPAAKRALQAKT